MRRTTRHKLQYGAALGALLVLGAARPGGALLGGALLLLVPGRRRLR
ncbi:MAG: hypothetical protein MJE66_18570 [Proteobacteria bacterium]|nr:hypothetical protein [Pseudomonadota bacterium]